jgi:hypothetical protein
MTRGWGLTVPESRTEIETVGIQKNFMSVVTVVFDLRAGRDSGGASHTTPFPSAEKMILAAL